MRAYERVTYYRCRILGEVCDQGIETRTPPNCSDCAVYIEWKASGKSIANHGKRFSGNGGRT